MASIYKFAKIKIMYQCINLDRHLKKIKTPKIPFICIFTLWMHLYIPFFFFFSFLHSVVLIYLSLGGLPSLSRFTAFYTSSSGSLAKCSRSWKHYITPESKRGSKATCSDLYFLKAKGSICFSHAVRSLRTSGATFIEMKVYHLRRDLKEKAHDSPTSAQ